MRPSPAPGYRAVPDADATRPCELRGPGKLSEASAQPRPLRTIKSAAAQGEQVVATVAASQAIEAHQRLSYVTGSLRSGRLDQPAGAEKSWEDFTHLDRRRIHAVAAEIDRFHPQEHLPRALPPRAEYSNRAAVVKELLRRLRRQETRIRVAKAFLARVRVVRRRGPSGAKERYVVRLEDGGARKVINE